MNTIGSYVCECLPGYMFDSNDNETCIDRDECADKLDKCSVNQTCVNTIGNYDCECKPGFQSMDQDSKPICVGE